MNLKKKRIEGSQQKLRGMANSLEGIQRRTVAVDEIKEWRTVTSRDQNWNMLPQGKHVKIYVRIYKEQQAM